MAQLFRDQQDLLEEFSQFLPEATHHHMNAKQAQEEQRRIQNSKKRAGNSHKQGQYDMKNATKKAAEKRDLGNGHHEDILQFERIKKALNNKKVWQLRPFFVFFFLRPMLSEADWCLQIRLMPG